MPSDTSRELLSHKLEKIMFQTIRVQVRWKLKVSLLPFLKKQRHLNFTKLRLELADFQEKLNQKVKAQCVTLIITDQEACIAPTLIVHLKSTFHSRYQDKASK
jgi:hypothetical protein